MIQRFALILGFFFTFFFQYIQSEPVVVSIGCNCQVALKLHKFQLRHASYPFDWVFSHSLYTVANCIEDNFSHWLDPNFLEYKGWHIYNTFYKIGFSHDFPTVETDIYFKEPITSYNLFRKNFKDYLPEITEKYNRRIKRFMDLLNSDKEVIFIYTWEGTKESALFFKNYIKNKFPNLKFTLVTVNVGSKNDKLQYPIIDGEWIHFLGYEFEPNAHWWVDTEWDAIFRQLGLY